MGYYIQTRTDHYRVFLKPKKSAESKYGNKSQYTTLSPEQIKSWSQNFIIEKVSKLIPAGNYTKSQYEQYLINGGLTKTDQENQKKVNQFVKQYNKTNKTNFKSIDDIISNQRQQKKLRANREAERKAHALKKRQEAKQHQEAILRFSALKLGIEKGLITQDTLDTPDARKLIREANHAQKVIITNFIDQIHQTPLLQRKQFKSQINSIKSQLHKEIDKI